MVLGQVVGVEASRIIGFDQLQPLLVVIRERQIAAVEVVEDAEFHAAGFLREMDGGRSQSQIMRPANIGAMTGLDKHNRFRPI